MQTGGDRKLHIWLVRIRRWYLAQEMRNSDQMKIPVKYIGVGEKMTDLQLFDRKTFVESLFNANN